MNKYSENYLKVSPDYCINYFKCLKLEIVAKSPAKFCSTFHERDNFCV